MFWDDADFFGGMFDFNGDGETDAAEQALGFIILDDMIREDEEALKDEIPAPGDEQSLDEEDMVKWREAELSSRPDLKEVYYMHSLYEEVIDDFNAQNIIIDFDDYFVEKYTNFTYLHPNNMMHIDDVDEIIEKERKKWDKQHSRK